MKIRPINDNDLCAQVRFNDCVSGTHILVMDGKPNEEKRITSLYPLLSMLVERGFITREDNDTKEEMLGRAFKNAESIVEGYSTRRGVRM